MTWTGRKYCSYSFDGLQIDFRWHFFFSGNGHASHKRDSNIYMFIEMIGSCKEILVSDESYNMLRYLNTELCGRVLDRIAEWILNIASVQHV